MRLTVAAISVAIVIAACSDAAQSNDTDTTISPRLIDALDVATAFTEGRAERDLKKMMANAIDGFINGFVVLSMEEMADEFEWLDAVGWSMRLDGCELTEANEDTPTVRCDVTHSDSISESLGVGPYPGSYYIKVRFPGDEVLGTPIEETVVTESHQTEFPILAFTTDTWRPFLRWLEERSPGEAETMLGFPVPQGVEFLVVAGERPPRLTDDSIELWRKWVVEFSESHG